jgi:hypothetical protein
MVGLGLSFSSGSALPQVELQERSYHSPHVIPAEAGTQASQQITHGEIVGLQQFHA